MPVARAGPVDVSSSDALDTRESKRHARLAVVSSCPPRESPRGGPGDLSRTDCRGVAARLPTCLLVAAPETWGTPPSEGESSPPGGDASPSGDVRRLRAATPFPITAFLGRRLPSCAGCARSITADRPIETGARSASGARLRSEPSARRGGRRRTWGRGVGSGRATMMPASRLRPPWSGGVEHRGDVGRGGIAGESLLLGGIRGSRAVGAGDRGNQGDGLEIGGTRCRSMFRVTRRLSTAI